MKDIHEHQAEPYYRVNAAMLADKAPTVPKSCKRCYGSGLLCRFVKGGTISDPYGCPDCGGTGTRVTT